MCRKCVEHVSKCVERCRRVDTYVSNMCRLADTWSTHMCRPVDTYVSNMCRPMCRTCVEMCRTVVAAAGLIRGKTNPSHTPTISNTVMHTSVAMWSGVASRCCRGSPLCELLAYLQTLVRGSPLCKLLAYLQALDTALLHLLTKCYPCRQRLASCQ
jgi:hypothetical protein